MPMKHPYEIACCGLNAAIDVLESAGIAVPTQTAVLHRPATLDCHCDALFVSAGPSRNASRLINGPTRPLPGLGNTCGKITAYTTSFEVHLSRCVVVQNPLEGKGQCGDQSECADVWPCPGETGPTWPTDANGCGTAAPDVATESYLLMHERFILEAQLASRWHQCLCTNELCGEECSPCGVNVDWLSTRVDDSGGCGGSILTFEVVTV